MWKAFLFKFLIINRWTSISRKFWKHFNKGSVNMTNAFSQMSLIFPHSMYDNPQL